MNAANGRVIPEVATVLRNQNCSIHFSTAQYFDTEGSKSVAVDQVLRAMHLTIDDNDDDTVNNETTTTTITTRTGNAYGTNHPPLCAITGAFRSEVTLATALLASIRGVPQFSPFSQSNQLEDSNSYPLFGRTVPSNDQEGGPLLEFITEVLNVTHLTVVHDATESSRQLTFWTGLRDAWIRDYYPSLVIESVGLDDRTNMTAVVHGVRKTGHRYILGLIPFQQMEPLMREATRQGIMGRAEYQWIFATSGLARLPVLHTRDSVIGLAGDGILSFALQSASPGQGRYDEFVEAFAELDNPDDIAYLSSLIPKHEDAPNYNPTFRTQTFTINPSAAAQVYDMVIALGLAACSVPTLTGTSSSSSSSSTPPDGASLYEAWTKTRFVGTTGTIEFDAKTGSRRSESALFSMANLVRREMNDTHFELSVEYPYLYNGGWHRKKDLVFSTGRTVAPPILPPLHVDYNYIGWGWRSGGWVLAFIAITSSLIAAVYTWCKRNTYAVRASQPIFLLLICVGTVLMACAIFPLSMDDEIAQDDWVDISCMMMPILLCMGWCVSFAAVYSKTRRVNLVFYQPRFQRITVKAQDVITPMVLLLTANALIFGLWLGLDPLHWERRTTASDKFNRPQSSHGTCISDHSWAFETPLLIVNVGAMIMAVRQLYVARKVSTDFSESDWIARALHSILIGSFLGIPLIVIASDDATAYYFVYSIVIFVVCMSLIGFIFVPKMSYDLMRRGDSTPFVAEAAGGIRSDASCAGRYLQSSQSFSDGRNSTSFRPGIRILGHPRQLEMLEHEATCMRKEIEDLKRALLQVTGSPPDGQEGQNMEPDDLEEQSTPVPNGSSAVIDVSESLSNERTNLE